MLAAAESGVAAKHARVFTPSDCTYIRAGPVAISRQVYRGHRLLHSITSGEIGNRLQKLRVIADVDGRDGRMGGHVDNSFRDFDVAGVASFQSVVYTRYTYFECRLP